jgi:hypothetical protein
VDWLEARSSCIFTKCFWCIFPSLVISLNFKKKILKKKIQFFKKIPPNLKKKSPFPQKQERKEKKKPEGKKKSPKLKYDEDRRRECVWWMNETLIMQELLIFCWYSVVLETRGNKKNKYPKRKKHPN